VDVSQLQSYFKNQINAHFYFDEMNHPKSQRKYRPLFKPKKNNLTVAVDKKDFFRKEKKKVSPTEA
jgi:hypothetical protein